MSKKPILDIIEREKLIVVARGVSDYKLVNLFGSLYDGGVRVAEITFGGDDDQVVATRLRTLISVASKDMCIGAGTVTDLYRARIASEAGAKFLVSPVFDAEVSDFCMKKDLLYIAGALTPTEIKRACDGGADIVKLFPASSLGSDYLKAVLAPLKGIPILAFGGITLQNAADFLRAGAIGVGVGSAIVDEDMLEMRDYPGLIEKAYDFVNAIKE